jgi:undecaprenyl diphosphate synthase
MMEMKFGFHPAPGPLPRHVGIIPDGGRRWAAGHDCSLHQSYIQTKARLKEFVVFLTGKGVKEVSVYLSSIQNFRRTAAEMAANLTLLEEALQHEIAEIAEREDLLVIIAGSREMLPESLLGAVNTLEKKTERGMRGRLNLLIAYDPLAEILQALKTAEQAERFTDHLWVSTPVDLVIRSGGAPVLSNFLPLQSGFARLVLFDQLFNDLTTGDLDEVLEQFSKTERKFGE